MRLNKIGSPQVIMAVEPFTNEIYTPTVLPIAGSSGAQRAVRNYFSAWTHTMGSADKMGHTERQV